MDRSVHVVPFHLMYRPFAEATSAKSGVEGPGRGKEGWFNAGLVSCMVLVAHVCTLSDCVAEEEEAAGVAGVAAKGQVFNVCIVSAAICHV